MRREWKLVSNNFAQNSFFMTQNRKSHLPHDPDVTMNYSAPHLNH